jgi:hypothetical protein
VTQRRQDFRLALKARQPIGIGGERRRQDLQRDVAFEPCIACAIDLSHATRPDEGDDLIGTEVITSRQRRHQPAPPRPGP